MTDQQIRECLSEIRTLRPSFAENDEILRGLDALERLALEMLSDKPPEFPKFDMTLYGSVD